MKELYDLIAPYAVEKKKLWWENYVKHDTKFLGVPMKDLRIVLENWCTEKGFSDYSKETAYDLVLDLFAGEYSEEKLLGILLLAEHLRHWSDDEILNLIEDLMRRRYIFDWNICDWLCVKVLTPRLNKEDFSIRLLNWSEEDYLWHRRAALVPFAQIEDHLKYEGVISQIAHNLIKSEERFSKTVVGWVYREMMPVSRESIINFMKANYGDLTAEVIGNILKHTEDKKEIKKFIRG